MNAWDLFLVGLCCLSAIIGFLRGLTREISSLGGWVGAAIGAVYVFPYAKDTTRTFITHTWISDIITGGILFFSFLFALLLLGDYVSILVKKSVLGGLDRSLGLGFGCARGAFLICIGYLVLLLFVPIENHPDFLKNARATPWIQKGASSLRNLVPKDFFSQSTWEKNLKKVEPFSSEESVKSLTHPQIAPHKPLSGPMNHLLNT